MLYSKSFQSPYLYFFDLLNISKQSSAFQSYRTHHLKSSPLQVLPHSFLFSKYLALIFFFSILSTIFFFFFFFFIYLSSNLIFNILQYNHLLKMFFFFRLSTRLGFASLQRDAPDIVWSQQHYYYFLSSLKRNIIIFVFNKSLF